MNETANARTHRRLRIRRPSLVESLVLVTIIAILVALLLPGPQWAADGSIEVPVRVRVFDAAEARPIPAAEVAIFRAPPPLPDFAIDQYRGRFSREYLEQVAANNRHVTGNDGSVVIVHEFRTGASHKDPEFRAHVSWEWVMVSAKGYGTVVVPVRYESAPTKDVREQGELFVAVGLMAAD
jgi:hypothetical protein